MAQKWIRLGNPPRGKLREAVGDQSARAGKGRSDRVQGASHENTGRGKDQPPPAHAEERPATLPRAVGSLFLLPSNLQENHVTVVQPWRGDD